MIPKYLKLKQMMVQLLKIKIPVKYSRIRQLFRGGANANLFALDSFYFVEHVTSTFQNINKY